ncbi:MAG: type II secretion system protein N [Hydrogenophaga sp.]|uniref:type II secretion system protein N n=1 Tax=Hydrogenophaga sp. TaxID=1904254 RepID=UPI003D9B69BC
MNKAIRARRLAQPSSSAPGLLPALAAGVLWLAAGLSAGYWVLLAWGRSPVTAVAAVPLAPMGSDAAAVARALGAVAPVAEAKAPAPVATASRYRLLGVVDQSGRRGAALIAIDGQPPRPYTVGAALEDGLVLQSVSRLGARLGASNSGPTTVELSLPQPAKN